MRHDVKSNYIIARAIAPDAHGAGVINSASVNHRDGSSASFFIDVGDVGGAGTVDAKLQKSEDDTVWTDEPDLLADNDTVIVQITAAGGAFIHVPNPRENFSRIEVTVGTNAVDMQVTSVTGPKRLIGNL